MIRISLFVVGMDTSVNLEVCFQFTICVIAALWSCNRCDILNVNSLSAKSVLAGEKLIATYSIST